MEIQVEDIIIGEIEHFKSIEEYRFSVLKMYIIYNKNAKQEISIRTVKRGKVKESIFCYWSLLYEEYIKENRKEMKQMPKNTVISQEIEKNSVILKFNPFTDYYAKIDLIELEKLPIRNKGIERWVEDLKAKKEDILFIGRKKVLKNV